MPLPLGPVRGRGTHSNPANRFDGVEHIAVPEALEDDDADAPRHPRTLYLRDNAATIITHNDSPDVGFDASLNPYRGCEHGCVYCVAAGTPVLRADGSLVAIDDLGPGDAIMGTSGRGHGRQYVPTRVLAHWATIKPGYRVSLTDGTQIVASADHRFLTLRGWKFVTGAGSGAAPRPRLTTNDTLMGIGRIATGQPHSEGHMHSIAGQPVSHRGNLRVASVEPLNAMLAMFDVTTGTGDFVAGGVISHNCYARPTHEYMGLSAGLDFETRIFVKTHAPELLRSELAARRWAPKVLGLSGVTDPYQPVERHLAITRGCLAVLAETRNPVAVITKGHLVTRDADLLGELARFDAAAVMVSITTLDLELAARMEPRASSPSRRLRAIRELSDAGVPVGVMVAPIVPGLTDHELPRILEAAADHGARFAGYTILRLPYAVKDLFLTWLDDHYPLRRDRVVNRIREIRGGALTDSTFHRRMKGHGPFADHVAALFRVSARRHGLGQRPSLSAGAFRRPDVAASVRQLALPDAP